MDVYVRVSKVGKRSGDSYRSPALQRDAIRGLAKREGIKEGKVITDEDVSGAKSHTDRGVDELIRRAEAGITEGVMVDTIDRLGRTMLDGCLAIKRLKDVGARIVSAEGDDSGREGGMKNIQFRLMIAEDYLENVTRRWKRATESAAAEGIQCGKAPIGYLRGEDGRLILDRPAVVEAVREAFRLRAEGASYTEATRPVEAALERPLSRNTLARMVKCRTYLGEIRRGSFVNKDAHEAIITPELFAAASRKESDRKVPRRPREHTAAELTLLSGIVCCAACGGPCKIQYDKRRDVASYVCAPRKDRCPAPGGAVASVVDDHVLWLLANDAGAATGAVEGEQQRVLEAREALRSAEAEVEMWMDDEEASPETRKKMILRAEAKTEAARAALYELPDLDLDSDVIWLDGRPVIADKWDDLTQEQKRAHLRRYIGSVKITKADPKRRRWQPISERITLTWKDGSEPVLPDQVTA